MAQSRLDCDIAIAYESSRPLVHLRIRGSTAHDEIGGMDMAKADRAPKKIAGLKLPKSIREAPAIRSLLATPEGRKILSDALIAGAATAAERVMEAHEAAKAKVADGRAVEQSEKAEKPAVALAKSKSEPKRSKAAKPAPGAAPVDDVKPAPAKQLMPVADAPDPLADDPDDELDDPTRPGAAD
jgi:hypothetical protein